MFNPAIDLGGTIRAFDTSTTLLKLHPLLKKLGITRIANVTGLDYLNIPVVLCIRPNSKHLSVSQGKGLSLELAEISAIMESIEGYHSENPIKPDLNGRYNDLYDKFPLMDPNQFSAGFFKVDRRQLTLNWVKTTNLINNEIIYIPHILICLDSTQSHAEYGYFNVSSNGLAAGNILEEAICHSLFEIIERDALSRFNQLPKPKQDTLTVKTSSINSQPSQLLIKKIEQTGLVLKIWDITSFLEIPTYHCLLLDPSNLNAVGNFRGNGTHLSKEIALMRALTEAAQTRLTIISGSRDDVFPNYYQIKNTSSSGNISEKNEYINFNERVTHSFNSFSEMIAYTTQQLTNHGITHILVHNHTKSELNIPVVQVFVPQLEFNGSRL